MVLYPHSNTHSLSNKHLHTKSGGHTCTCPIFCYKYEKHFQKMYRDVGMAVPKTTETRCRDGSVQARHVIQRLHN